MHDDAMQNVMLEYDNGKMPKRYVHYDTMKRCLCDAWYKCMLEIKCRNDLIRTNFWIKNMGQTHFIQKVITSQDLSDNTNFLAVPNYMGH